MMAFLWTNGHSFVGERFALAAAMAVSIVASVGCTNPVGEGPVGRREAPLPADCGEASRLGVDLGTDLVGASARVVGACRSDGPRCDQTKEEVERVATDLRALAGDILQICGSPSCPDLDGDGFTTCDGDCDDDDPSIHPGAHDVPDDGIDQDCDGADATESDSLDLAVVQPFFVDGSFYGVFAEVARGRGDGSFRGMGPDYQTIGIKFTNSFELSRFAHFPLGDVDGDGKADLVVVQPYFVDSSLHGIFYEIAYGNGDGTFEPVGDEPGGLAIRFPNPREFARFAHFELGDLDGDGLADLVILQPYWIDGTFSGVFYEVSMGNGDGTFTPLEDEPGLAIRSTREFDAAEPAAFRLGDVDGDGLADLSILQPDISSDHFQRVTVEVGFGNGDGTFAAVGETPERVRILHTSPADEVRFTGLRMADVDDDGLADLVVVQPFFNGESFKGVFYETSFGNGDGTFRPSEETAQAVDVRLTNSRELADRTQFPIARID